jgi:hypothetical protein
MQASHWQRVQLLLLLVLYWPSIVVAISIITNFHHQYKRIANTLQQMPTAQRVTHEDHDQHCKGINDTRWK